MRIQHKLFAIHFFSSVFLLVTFVLILQWSLGKGMLDYVNAREVRALEPVTETLITIYQESKSWQEIQDNHQEFRHLIETNLQGSEFQLGGRISNGESLEGASVNYALLDANKRYVVGKYPPDQSYDSIELVMSEELLGYLLVPKRAYLSAGYELNFVKQQQNYLLLIALGLLLLTMLISLPLFKHFFSPIRQFTAAMGQLTQGNHGQSFDLKGNDEFSHIGEDFNQLAASLQRNEETFKRGTGDISYALTTSVAVLKGEIAAMLEGGGPIRLTQLEVANEELKQLERLVKNLDEYPRIDLKGADYHKTVLELGNFLLGEVEKHQPLLQQKNIHINLILLKALVIIYADQQRLQQLFDNLFMNIINSAGDANLVQVSALVDKDVVRVVLEDNGREVEDQYLEQLFDHPYLLVNFRSRSTLDLAICKQVVAAHQGNISARKSSLGGLAIHIEFPLHK